MRPLRTKNDSAARSPVNLAAIDAGTNAIRMVIFRAWSPAQFEELEFERVPLRLGHHVFTRHRLDDEVIRRAAQVFRRFRARMERHHVSGYRAVATAAARESRNRAKLLRRIRREARLQLDVIDTQEEAALVRKAVQGALGEELEPRLVADLGGGSLELSLLRGQKVEHSAGLPLGTVRLLETYGVHGALSEEDVRKLRAHILAVLASNLPHRLDLEEETAVLCGGNAEALALVAPGPRWRGLNTLNLRLLRERQWDILALDPAQRMKRFHVRSDRADVMGIATIVFTTLARWANVSRALVPGVGVRQGLMRALAEKHFASAPAAEQELESRALVESARSFAARLHDDAAHGEQVRRLALSLFDQLRSIHGMGGEERLVLELGALLHDVGRAIHEEAHHKHGEYLVRHGEITGLRGTRRDMVACLVRYHNRRSEPDLGHKVFASLAPNQRGHVRALAALLRLADGLDGDRKQSVVRVDVETTRREAFFRVHSRVASNVPLHSARRRAALFEDEFGLQTTFHRTRAAMRVA
ncbi:MAG TPA: HD domain-containing protein [Candidatus Nitrosotenuis sp.]|nr:HD domain-containing protein [Candidatus Nitrosotenuis sp.]